MSKWIAGYVNLLHRRGRLFLAGVAVVVVFQCNRHIAPFDRH